MVQGGETIQNKLPLTLGAEIIKDNLTMTVVGNIPRVYPPCPHITVWGE